MTSKKRARRLRKSYKAKRRREFNKLWARTDPANRFEWKASIEIPVRRRSVMFVATAGD